jgi:hypothetical protein
MKALINASGQLGPFTTITELPDRWVCDGIEYQHNVVGSATVGDWIQPPTTLPIVEVPLFVYMRQARLSLLQANKLQDVENAIAALPSPQKEIAQIEWEYATEVRRNSSLVYVLISMLNMTELEVDALFIAASKL